MSALIPISNQERGRPTVIPGPTVAFRLAMLLNCLASRCVMDDDFGRYLAGSVLNFVLRFEP
jgi:hypothetical protein